MEYGKLYVIPDENQILEEEFYKDIRTNHLDGFQEFSDQYQLGYQFKKEEYQDAPCYLALDGHLILKTVDDSGLVIIYIPEVVTDRQYMWFYNHQNLLAKYSMIGAYAVHLNENGYDTDEIEGMDRIMQIFNRKNMLYQEKKSIDIYQR